MPKLIAFLVFLLIELIFLPSTILGMILFAGVFLREVRGKNISITAYDPLFAHWVLDALGKRDDEAAGRLLYALPGGSPGLLGLAFGPTMWAMHVTGFTIKMYDYPVHSSSGIFAILGHRTTFFDDALLRHLDHVEQVVILGAGWDTRAYGMARRKGVRVFEVDTVETQAQKRESLEKAKIDSTDVTFAPANFNKESWLDALKRVGFDPDKPTFILWEGVTYYLEAEAVEATIQTVATQLAKGSAIAFDYAAKHIIEGDASLFVRIALLELRIFGEPWMFGISTDPPAKEQLVEFLGHNGLKLAEYEPIGKGDKKQRLDGGLALAVNN
ncbi:MAG: SAM-dependent methyltransferase [Candidatus Bathyarchaeota archaeon]|nr:MAG: SAM-dependent methyltransferase [Candidatus Bathyarchaeota archaeon]